MDLDMMNDAVFRIALDADFHVVMKGVGFSLTPREYLTVGDMIRYHESITKYEELTQSINNSFVSF